MPKESKTPATRVTMAFLHHRGVKGVAQMRFFTLTCQHSSDRRGTLIEGQRGITFPLGLEGFNLYHALNDLPHRLVEEFLIHPTLLPGSVMYQVGSSSYLWVERASLNGAPADYKRTWLIPESAKIDRECIKFSLSRTQRDCALVAIDLNFRHSYGNARWEESLVRTKQQVLLGGMSLPEGGKRFYLLAREGSVVASKTSGKADRGITPSLQFRFRFMEDQINVLEGGTGFVGSGCVCAHTCVA